MSVENTKANSIFTIKLNSGPGTDFTGGGAHIYTLKRLSLPISHGGLGESFVPSLNAETTLSLSLSLSHGGLGGSLVPPYAR
jgi:hypothetical protein